MPVTNTVLIHIDHGEDQDEEVITFDHTKLLLAEAIAVEEETGWSIGQVLGYAGIGSYKAYRAMVWIMRKRSNPKLRPSDVVLTTGQIWIEDPDLIEDEELELPEAPKGPEPALPEEQLPVPTEDHEASSSTPGGR